MRKVLLHLVFSGMAIFSATNIIAAATLQVGPGQAYAKPCAAILVAAPGDTILIDAAGSYAGDVCQWFTNGLTLRGVNGRPHIDANGKNAVGKGIWVIDGDNTTVENIELSGATVPDGNGAGIRFESNNLVVRGCYIHSNVVDYMGEGVSGHNPDHSLFVSNNTFVNDKTFGNFILVPASDTTPVVLQNNIFRGPGTVTNQASAILTNNLVNVDPLFVNPTTYDYHLQSASPAINAGIVPGFGAGQSLNPDYDYVHSSCGETRTASGVVDIGAYEYGSVGSLLSCTTGTGTGTPTTALVGLTVTPNAVVAGGTSTATVTLSNPAPPGGIVVTMTSNNSSVAMVPGNLTIAAGYSGGSVPITTGHVTASTVAAISATYNGVKKTTSLAGGSSFSAFGRSGEEPHRYHRHHHLDFERYRHLASELRSHHGVRQFLDVHRHSRFSA